jgi:hypothetical protein
MFHVGETVVLASPEDPQAKMEEELPPLLGESFRCIDLKEARERTAAKLGIIAVFDSIPWKPHASDPSVPATDLTLWQMAQLLSITQGELLDDIQLDFCPLDDVVGQLFGHVSWPDPANKSLAQAQLPLCHTLSSIRSPIEAAEFGRIKIAQNSSLSDTAFELDPKLTQAAMKQKNCG